MQFKVYENKQQLRVKLLHHGHKVEQVCGIGKGNIFGTSAYGSYVLQVEHHLEPDLGTIVSEWPPWPIARLCPPNTIHTHC